MSLLFVDSFDHYSLDFASGQQVADILTKWTRKEIGLGGPYVVPGLHGNALGGAWSKALPFGSNTMIAEAFFKGNTGTLWDVLDTGTAVPEQGVYIFSQAALDVNSNGCLVVTYQSGGNNATVLWMSPPDVFRQNVWYHIAWRITVDQHNGGFEVRLNGGSLCNINGVPTAQPYYWSGQIGAVRLQQSAGLICDDLVVMDDVNDGIDDPRLEGGGGFDKFLGPIKIVVKYPNGPGALAQWTPAPVQANYLNVNEHTPDGDTTTNGTDTNGAGLSDLFTMDPLLSTEDIVGAQSLVQARKTQEGTAAVARLAYANGTLNTGPTVYQPDSYNYMILAEPKAPDGSMWSATTWNEIQYGYKRII